MLVYIHENASFMLYPIMAMEFLVLEIWPVVCNGHLCREGAMIFRKQYVNETPTNSISQLYLEVFWAWASSTKFYKIVGVLKPNSWA